MHGGTRLSEARLVTRTVNGKERGGCVALQQGDWMLP